MSLKPTNPPRPLGGAVELADGIGVRLRAGINCACCRRELSVHAVRKVDEFTIRMVCLGCDVELMEIAL